VRVVLFSYHALLSPRQAGFHRLAVAYRRRGWDVDFVTAPLSLVHRLRCDKRFGSIPRRAFRDFAVVAPGVRTLALLTGLHPLSARDRTRQLAGWASADLYAKQRLGLLADALSDADLVVMESTPAIVLAPRVRSLAPRARFVYRVSDELAVLGASRRVLQREIAAAALFDLISVPHPSMAARYRSYNTVRVQPHGIDAASFDRAGGSPYGSSAARYHACYVGASHFDRAALAIAASARPDIHFHIIGPVARSGEAHNVTFYGELPWSATVPFIRFADLGLFFIPPSTPSIESFGFSLKLTQYAYCGIPILGPSAVATTLPRYVGYERADRRSIDSALTCALATERGAVGALAWPTWDQVAEELVSQRAATDA
jgi:2-beta-glucuronyltransferase